MNKAIEKQKQIEDFLQTLELTPVNEWESCGVMFTEYDTVGIAVIIERKL